MMEEKVNPLVNACNFTSVKPIMMELPYPPIQVKEKNQAYANMLSIDYCGAVSELSAITQYINNENRLSLQMCSIAKIILGIAMAEMIHLQKLGELMILLGGNPDFVARHGDGRQRMWSPQFVSITDNPREMMYAGIDAEKQAIDQYWRHIKRIDDSNINAVLERIIQDEEYHIMILQALIKEL